MRQLYCEAHVRRHLFAEHPGLPIQHHMRAKLVPECMLPGHFLRTDIVDAGIAHKKQTGHH